jgi:hypothetical protein
MARIVPWITCGLIVLGGAAGGWLLTGSLWGAVALALMTAGFVQPGAPSE